MTDKPKFPPPFPGKKHDADDEDETLLDVKIELPPADEWDESDPTIVGESLALPPRGDAGVDDETITNEVVRPAELGEWDDAEPTLIGEPIEPPDQADTAPREAPAGEWDDAEPTMIGAAHDVDHQAETAPRPRLEQPSPAPSQSLPAPRARRPQAPSPERVSSPAVEPAPSPDAPDGTPEEQGAPVDFKDALSLFIVGGALCMALMLVVSVRQWLAPWAPIAASLGIAAVVSASIGFVYCERDRQQALLKGFGICAAFAIPTLLWLIGPVRVTAMEQLGEYLPAATQQKALLDPSRDVQVESCVQAANSGDRLLEVQLVELFSTAPSIGAECIAKLDQAAPGRAQTLRRRFLRRWGIALRKQHSELVCGAAPYLFSLQTAAEASPTQQLTYCATTTSDERSAKCCADALTDRFDSPQKYTLALGDTSTVPVQRRAALFAAMVSHAFAGVDAARISLPGLERRLLRKKPVQDWILSLGCHDLFGGEGASDLLAGLEAIVESRSCPSGHQIERERKHWQRICADMIDHQRSSDQLCEGVHRETVAVAVRTATAEVHAALDAMFADETTPGIVRAHAKFNRFASSVDSKGAFMAEGISPLGTQRVGDVHTQRAAREIGGNYKQAVRQMKEEAARIEGKDRPDYDESVQDLLQRDVYKPQASWEEVKRQMSSEESNRLQRQLDQAKRKLDR